MGQLKVEGNLVAGPVSATDTFPAAVFTAPFATAQNPKGFQVATGILTRRLQSPLAFLALPELGGSAAVTRGTFHYMRSDSPVDVRLTTDDGSGGNVVAVVPLQGLSLREYPDNKYLKLIEVMGTGTLEYFVCGQQ